MGTVVKVVTPLIVRLLKVMALAPFTIHDPAKTTFPIVPEDTVPVLVNVPPALMVRIPPLVVQEIVPALEILPAETVALLILRFNEPVPVIVIAFVTAIAPVEFIIKLPPVGIVSDANGVPVVAPPVCVMACAIVTVLPERGVSAPNHLEAVFITPALAVIYPKKLKEDTVTDVEGVGLATTTFPVKFAPVFATTAVKLVELPKTTEVAATPLIVTVALL